MTFTDSIHPTTRVWAKTPASETRTRPRRLESTNLTSRTPATGCSPLGISGKVYKCFLLYIAKILLRWLVEGSNNWVLVLWRFRGQHVDLCLEVCEFDSSWLQKYIWSNENNKPGQAKFLAGSLPIWVIGLAIFYNKQITFSLAKLMTITEITVG